MMDIKDWPRAVVVSGGSTNGGLWEGFEIHFRELVEKEIKKTTNVS